MQDNTGGVGSWTAATQQCSQMSDDSELELVNENVRRLSGLEPHVQLPRCVTPDDTTEAKKAVPLPIADPSTISDAQVQLRTGFSSLFLMLAFLVVIYDGSLRDMAMTTTLLTWFEEWMMYFEWVWGRQSTTTKSLAKNYKTSKSTAERILEDKRWKVLDAMRRWPRFASFEEDWELRSERWWRKYRKDARVIFWDDTNIAAVSPSDADTNRSWFSYYYDATVAKGAVFLQLCGWMGCWELWAGAISNTDYQQSAGVFHFQELFVRNCPRFSSIDYPF